MTTPTGSSNIQQGTDKKQNRFLSVLKVALLFLATLVSAGILVVTAVFIIANRAERLASQEEYAALQEIAGLFGPEFLRFSALDIQMREINPDYICWIRIDGTPVDYPVVRGFDNEKYLDISFSGEENALGALFMDYRCVGEVVPHIIIYGHNSRDGELFGDLWRFLDRDFMARNPIITLIVNGRVVEYEIFSARKTDVNDPAYQLDFSVPGFFRDFAERNGAPPDAAQIITLSTCFSGDDDDERVIVQGVLR